MVVFRSFIYILCFMLFLGCRSSDEEGTSTEDRRELELTDAASVKAQRLYDKTIDKSKVLEPFPGLIPYDENLSTNQIWENAMWLLDHRFQKLSDTEFGCVNIDTILYYCGKPNLVSHDEMVTWVYICYREDIQRVWAFMVYWGDVEDVEIADYGTSKNDFSDYQVVKPTDLEYRK